MGLNLLTVPASASARRGRRTPGAHLPPSVADRLVLVGERGNENRKKRKIKKIKKVLVYFFLLDVLKFTDASIGLFLFVRKLLSSLLVFISSL